MSMHVWMCLISPWFNDEKDFILNKKYLFSNIITFIVNALNPWHRSTIMLQISNTLIKMLGYVPHIYIHTHTHVCVYVCMYIYIYIYVCVCIYLCLCVWVSLSIYIYKYIYIYMCVCVWVYISAFVCILCICVHMWMCMYLYIFFISANKIAHIFYCHTNWNLVWGQLTLSLSSIREKIRWQNNFHCCYEQQNKKRNINKMFCEILKFNTVHVKYLHEYQCT